MYLDVNRLVRFMARHKIGHHEVFFLYCLKFREYDAIKIYKEAFPTYDGSMIGADLKQNLITLGFIEHVGEGASATDYRITDKFNKLFLADKFAAAEEIWKEYPGYARIGSEGKAIPLTNMDFYQFANTYAERIKNSVEEHLEVLEDLRFAKQNGMLNYGIKKFVESEQWRKIRPLRKNQDKIITVEKLLEDF